MGARAEESSSEEVEIMLSSARPVRIRANPIALAAGVAVAAAAAPVPAAPQVPGAYTAMDGWARLPAGRTWGAVTGVRADPDGRHIWVLDRCGDVDCLGSDLAPVFKFDLDGRVVANFGAGLFAWPHGLYVDPDGNVWVADGPTGARAREGAAEGKGQQVFKLSPTGQVLMTLGRAGVSGTGRELFTGPSAVTTAPNGDIYVLDGHGAGGNNRVVKFDRSGRYLLEWGGTGPGPAAGEMGDAHAIALDSQGRVFVADRWNVRIQIFDQQGAFLEQWTHFGPVSDIYIDADDVLYVTDTQTTALPAWYGERRSEGWVRGIRVGDARTGRVTMFIPSEAEFLAADRQGNVYGAEVPGQTLVKYAKSDSP
jgi:DNA-binding beta-propeller fold protein YncE